jgi:hypothetical protein
VEIIEDPGKKRVWPPVRASPGRAAIKDTVGSDPTEATKYKMPQIHAAEESLKHIAAIQT